MKKLITFIITFILTGQVWAAREVQNGGGGWMSDGEYKTFYSAEIPVTRKPLEINEIPGLSFLLKKVVDLHISENHRAKLLDKILPTSKRIYYRVNADRLDAEKYQELISKYSAVMGVAKENLTIFATTDAKSAETFLLPDFYKLTELELAVVLLHESAWMLDPLLDYQGVVTFEQATQAFFEDGTTAQNVHSFYRQLSLLLKDPRVALLPTLQFDIDAGVLPARLVLKDVFGESYLTCLASPVLDAMDMLYHSQNCARTLQSQILKLSLKHPSSLFFAALLNYLNTGHSILLQKQKPSADILNGLFLKNSLKEQNGNLVLEIKDSYGSKQGVFLFL
ncbi:MAG: hypothetical protein HUU57_10475 [Bdellovibrio sp.]|nr:hypothetical protein [Bdellovibrio sp.]